MGLALFNSSEKNKQLRLKKDIHTSQDFYFRTLFLAFLFLNVFLILLRDADHLKIVNHYCSTCRDFVAMKDRLRYVTFKVSLLVTVEGASIKYIFFIINNFFFECADYFLSIISGSTAYPMVKEAC